MSTCPPEFGPSAGGFTLAELLEGPAIWTRSEGSTAGPSAAATDDFAALAVSGLASLLEKRGDPTAARDAYMTALASPSSGDISPWGRG